MSIESESEIYRMKANETTGELKEATTTEQYDDNQELLDIIDIPENNDDLLREIEAEDQINSMNYFEVMSKLENLDQKQIEQMWTEVGDKLKEIGIFTNHAEEGIDVFKEKSEWASPYPISRLSQEEIQSIFKRKFINIGGFYKDGKVYINEGVQDKRRGPTRDNLASLAAGHGLGAETDTFIHENYHGFQDLDPETVQQFQRETSELQDRIKAIKLEAEIAGQPAYKAVPLRGQLEEKRKALLETRTHGRLQTKDELSNRAIVREIHSNMFSDPARYRGDIKSYSDEGVTSAYSEMPIRRIHEKMLGSNRENENQDEIFRYDYMAGKEDQAYMAFKQIEALRALGMNNLEIGQIISDDEFDEEEGNYKKLQEAIFQRREQLGIDRDQHLKIIKRFQLSTIHKALKARNIAQDSLSAI